MTTARVADILATLVAAGPESSWPHKLVEESHRATGMSGVGRALLAPDGAAGVLAATSDPAAEIENQLELGQGSRCPLPTRPRPMGETAADGVCGSTAVTKAPRRLGAFG